ncbi:uncharacterized protein LOC130743728 [Lotus japonicus]|uniref:uncharacterized protein LOC130743728 n=1 Tax=Lotus japonicus TaxID=34305 RepID=UPI002583F8DA|nr:uncharacterized protein LOC130743728 [Lotus japonicus]
MKNPQLFQDKAILAPTLEVVKMINTYMLCMIAAPEHEYLSSDSACDLMMILKSKTKQQVYAMETKLTVDEFGERVIGAIVITGTNANDKVHISRMNSVPFDSKFPIKFRRKQFPIAVGFAMTINKSQGQTLSQVELFLLRSVFTHDQLYVALYRVL